MVEPAATATPQRNELAIGADGAEVRRASEWLSTICAQCDVPEAQAQRLEICLNEVLANVLAHGGSGAKAVPIRLQVDIRSAAGSGEAGVTVSDAGCAFNPLEAQLPTRPNTLAEARIGGLGLVMIRRCADWLDYRYDGGLNHLTFGARWRRA